jgi:VWFA-related protein
MFFFLLLALIARGSVLNADDPAVVKFSACAEVRIAEIEVFVTDRQSQPVTGLTPDSFKLYENGRPVEILNFYEARDQGTSGGIAVPDSREESLVPPEAQAVQGQPDPPRLLIVYVDNVNIHPLNRSRFFKAFKEFLYSGLDDRTRIMLVTNDRFHHARLSWGSQGSLRIRQAFTDDPTRITFALDELEILRGDRAYYDLERQDILREISRAEVGDPMARWRIMNRVKTYSASIFNDVKFSVRALADFIESLTGLSGHKLLLYVSDGFPMRSGEDVYFVLKEKYGSESVGMQDYAYDITRQLEGLAAGANANGVTIYSLDTSGLAGQSSTSAASASGVLTSMIDTVERKNCQNPLLFMSTQTGGRAIVDTTRIGQALGSITGDYRNYYSLGFHPAPDSAGDETKIKVKVRGRGLKLRYRRGVREVTPEHRMEGAIHACLLYGYRTNPLNLGLDLGTVEEAGKGTYLVNCKVTIPYDRLTFIPDGKGSEALVRLFIAVEDDQGVLSPIREISVPIRSSGDGENLREDAHRYEMRLLMARGRQTLVVGVLDDVSCLTSFITLACEVGAGPATLTE